MTARPLSSFYSSPSCDGDPQKSEPVASAAVSILPRLATGIHPELGLVPWAEFLFFPVLRRGSSGIYFPSPIEVSILPRLATGINSIIGSAVFEFVSILPRLATGIATICACRTD